MSALVTRTWTKNVKDEVSLWVLFSRACSAVTYISNTTLVKSA